METKNIKRNKTFSGTVVSDAMDKTVVVSVSRFKKHGKYGKYQKSDKKYHAHDEKNEYKVGDKVIIGEISPVSKTKSFRVVGYKK